MAVDKVLAFLLEHQSMVVAVVAGVVDMAMRLLKTEKPLSVMELVAVVLHKAASGAEYVADVLDKVLGQRVKAPLVVEAKKPDA